MRLAYSALLFLAASVTILGFGRPTSACPLIEGLIDFNCDGRHTITGTGDSIVAGVGDELHGGRGGYMERLESLFPSSEIRNLGYPGITTPQLLRFYKRLFKSRPESAEALAVGTADILIIDVGRNDYFNRNSSTLTVTTIRRLVSFLATETKKRFGLSPLIVTTILTPSTREFDKGFIEQVNMVALKTRSKRYLPAYLRFDLMSPTLLSEDGLHPSSAGFDVLGSLAEEYIRDDAQRRASALRRDRDSDGIFDLFENLRYATSPRIADTDADLLSDGEEVFRYLTDPLATDTDGDGVDDYAEIQNGSDPLNPRSP
jgi:lysophospholipase L1-like esterase